MGRNSPRPVSVAPTSFRDRPRGRGAGLASVDKVHLITRACARLQSRVRVALAAARSPNGRAPRFGEVPSPEVRLRGRGLRPPIAT